MKLPHSMACLRNPHLRVYFPAQFVFQIGSVVQWVSISWLVYKMTNSAEMTGLSRFIRQFPVLLIGTVAGVVVDRYAKKQLLLLAQGILFLQACALAVLAALHMLEPWHLLLSCGIAGSVNAVQTPACQSWTWGLAPEVSASTVSVASALGHIALMLGPAIGGYLLSGRGEATCFAISALSLLPVMIVIQLTPTREREIAGKAQPAKGGAISLAASNPIIGGVLCLVVASSVFGLPYTTLLTIMAKETLNGRSEVLGVLLSTAGFGALVGIGVVLARPEPRRAELEAARGAILLALSLIGLAQARSVLVAQVFLGLIGYGYITQGISSQKFIRRVTPDHLRGQMLGLYSALFFAESLGALGAGWLAAKTSVSNALMTGACILLAVCIGFYGLTFGQWTAKRSSRIEKAGYPTEPRRMAP